MSRRVQISPYIALNKYFNENQAKPARPLFQAVFPVDECFHILFCTPKGLCPHGTNTDFRKSGILLHGHPHLHPHPDLHPRRSHTLYLVDASLPDCMLQDRRPQILFLSNIDP